MRVLFVGSGKSNGKVSSILLGQGNSIEKQGVHVDYFAIMGSGISSYFKNIGILRRFLKNNDYDIIHAHYGLSGIVAYFAKQGQKLIVSYMGDDLIGTNKPNGSVYLVSRFFRWINIFFSKYLYDHTIVKSEEMKSIMRFVKSLSLIPNGVCLETFYPEAKVNAKDAVGFNQNKKYIVFVSNPSRVEKNYRLAYNSCALLSDEDVELFIVNGVPNNELYHYYNAAELLIMTSMHEGSPNVVKEAMACNCPCVSTNVGDVNFLFDRLSGYFICSSSAQSVSEKIGNALDYRQKNHFTNGRQRIVDLKLDSYSVAQRIINLYYKVSEIS